MFIDILRLKIKIYSYKRQIKRLRLESHAMMRNKKILKIYQKSREWILIIATLFGGSIFFQVFSKARAIISKIILLRLERLFSGLLVLLFRKPSKKLDSFI